MCVCICHSRDRKKIFLVSKDKDKVLSLESSLQYFSVSFQRNESVTKCQLSILFHVSFRQELPLLNNRTSVTPPPPNPLPPVDPFPLWCKRPRGSGPAVHSGQQVGPLCEHYVTQRSNGHLRKQLRESVTTTPKHWNRRGLHPLADQSSTVHHL